MTKKPEVKNKALKRKFELEAEIKRLGKLLPKLELGVSPSHKTFLLEQANSRFRSSGSKEALKIPMVKGSNSIDGRIKQYQTELTRINTYLGSRHLTRGSRVPTGYTWSFKPEPGKNYMINKDYIADYDPELQKQAKVLADKKANEIELTKEEEVQNEVLNQPNEALKINPIDTSLNPKKDSPIQTKAKELVKQRAPSDLAWADEFLPKGHTLTRTGSVGGKNSVANNRARLILSRAQDINRAYGGMNDEAKKGYLSNPITQLELEA